MTCISLCCTIVQSLVNNEYNSGDRTQPCGVLVLKFLILDVNLPALTACLQHKRKSEIHSQIVT